MTSDHPDWRLDTAEFFHKNSPAVGMTKSSSTGAKGLEHGCQGLCYAYLHSLSLSRQESLLRVYESWAPLGAKRFKQLVQRFCCRREDFVIPTTGEHTMVDHGAGQQGKGTGEKNENSSAAVGPLALAVGRGMTSLHRNRGHTFATLIQVTDGLTVNSEQRSRRVSSINAVRCRRGC